jgi:hypothetical protein
MKVEISNWRHVRSACKVDRTMPDRPEPDVTQLHAALDGKLEGYLRTDEASRAMWSTDASIYLRKPVGVVVARSEEDVELTLSAARDLGLSITPRGTGTSLAGQATAPGLALDVSEMRRALEIDLEGRRCVVEPGLVQGELNAMVEPHGLVFGADTSTSDVATLGGMVGNNSAGMRSLVYGMTSDQVLGLRCMLASGETVELAPLGREEARGRARHADALARLLRGAMEIGDRYNDEIRRWFPRARWPWSPARSSGCVRSPKLAPWPLSSSTRSPRRPAPRACSCR